MSQVELKTLFASNGVKQKDFIAWAERKGVKITPSEVSRHLTKKDISISRWAALAYRWFFSYYL